MQRLTHTKLFDKLETDMVIEMEHVKDHFEEEAKIFDELIRTIIPFYKDMVDSLVLTLPFHRKERIKFWIWAVAWKHSSRLKSGSPWTYNLCGPGREHDQDGRIQTLPLQ